MRCWSASLLAVASLIGCGCTHIDRKTAAADLFKEIKNHNVSGVRAALKEGADPNAFDPDGDPQFRFTALEESIEQPAIVQELLDSGANPHLSSMNVPPICLAAGAGGSQVIQMLLDKGATVNESGPDCGSPLCMAAQFGNVSNIDFLIGRGGNPRLTNGVGRGPLHQLALAPLSPTSKEIEGTVEALVKAGVDPAARDKRGMTAADLARRARPVKSALAAMLDQLSKKKPSKPKP